MILNCPTCNAEISAKEVECFYFVKVVAECKKCNNYFWGYGMDYNEAVEEVLDEIKAFKKTKLKVKTRHAASLRKNLTQGENKIK